MDPAPSPKFRARNMILTVGVAAITMVGTFYGAGLKTEHQAKERRTQAAVASAVAASPAAAGTVPRISPEDEFIAALESRRRALVQTKQTWETKAAALRARMQANAAAAAAAAAASSDRSTATK